MSDQNQNGGQIRSKMQEYGVQRKLYLFHVHNSVNRMEDDFGMPSGKPRPEGPASTRQMPKDFLPRPGPEILAGASSKSTKFRTALYYYNNIPVLLSVLRTPHSGVIQCFYMDEEGKSSVTFSAPASA
jgi:hypothetical protein